MLRWKLTTADAAFFRFMVDGATPTPGPTTAKGFYRISDYLASVVSTKPYSTHLNYAVTVLATVKNDSSDRHKVAVDLACKSNNAYMTGCVTISQ